MAIFSNNIQYTNVPEDLVKNVKITSNRSNKDNDQVFIAPVVKNIKLASRVAKFLINYLINTFNDEPYKVS